VALFLLGALSTACVSRDLSFPVEHLAGSGIAYWNLAHHSALIDLHGGDTTHLGAVRVDLVKREAHLVEDLRVYGVGRFDRRGRHFETWGQGCVQVICFDPDHGWSVLARGGFNQNLDLVVAQYVTWLFWIRDLGDPDEGGPFQVFRMDVDAGRIDVLPLPPGLVHRVETGDKTLSAQDGSVVYVVERLPGDPRRYRTWRGDFATQSWAEPIEGSFKVIDAQGTLLEQHADSHRIEIIRGSRRETVDLGLGGFVEPVFGTGYVRLKDIQRKQYVFRSLRGQPDFRVPRRPPPYRGEPGVRGPPTLDWPESVAPTRP
jgi:hypothetical protein